MRFNFNPTTAQLDIVGKIPTKISKVVVLFDTDISTAVGDLLKISGTNFVSTISDNFSATIPNGVFGISLFKPTTTSVEVLFVGVIGGYSGFTTGSPLFISTTGVPTHTVPTTGMVQQIGFAVSSTELFVQLMQPMRRA